MDDESWSAVGAVVLAAVAGVVIFGIGVAVGYNLAIGAMQALPGLS